jgi:hypothetical protein
VSDTAVNKAIRAGKITTDCLDYSNPKRPKINPPMALASWGRHYAPDYLQSPALADLLEQKQAERNNPKPKPETKKPKPNRISVDVGEELPVVVIDDFDPESDPDDPDDDNIKLRKSATHVEAKRVDAIATARLNLVKLAEARGKLVSREKVYKEFFDAGVRVRTALQGIPDKWIDNLLACDSRAEAHSMLYNAITEALERMVIENAE